MRLTKFEAESIKESVYGSDPDARIILFGSRVDDTKRGGDIDLLVLSGKITPRERRRIKINLYDKIGEQKIDIIVTPEITTAFHRIALSEGIEL